MYSLSGLALIGISVLLIFAKYKSAYAGLGETRKALTWEFLE